MGALECSKAIMSSSGLMEEKYEDRICKVFIDHLSDKSNEVKSNAVHCILQVQ